MCALADHHLDVHEYTALQIKKSVVGNGHAAKEQVQAMVQNLLKLNGLPSSDSADALACAICHAHVGALAGKLNTSGALSGLGGVRLRGGRLSR
jgi:crossover junction endodeoxyribonuclease RuvC